MQCSGNVRVAQGLVGNPVYSGFLLKQHVSMQQPDEESNGSLSDEGLLCRHLILYCVQLLRPAVMQIQTVEDDRRRLAEKLSAAESSRHGMLSDRLAQLEAQLAVKDTQIRDQAARYLINACLLHHEADYVRSGSLG